MSLLFNARKTMSFIGNSLGVSPRPFYVNLSPFYFVCSWAGASRSCPRWDRLVRAPPYPHLTSLAFALYVVNGDYLQLFLQRCPKGNQRRVPSGRRRSQSRNASILSKAADIVPNQKQIGEAIFENQKDLADARVCRKRTF